MQNRPSIVKQINNIEDWLDLLQERAYNVELDSSELREINKRKKKLVKNKKKLIRKLKESDFN